MQHVSSFKFDKISLVLPSLLALPVPRSLLLMFLDVQRAALE